MKHLNFITEEEKLIIDRITDDCNKLHILSPPKCFLTLEVHDNIGIPTEKQEMLSKSWVRNAYNILTTSIMGLNMSSGGGSFGAGSCALKSIAGNVLSPEAVLALYTNNMVGSAGSVTKGIVVGTGTGAESFEDYKLGTIITNGNTTGKLDYSAQVATSMAYDAGTRKMTSTLKRYIANNSGSPIVVSEVGIYLYEDTYTSSTFLVNRDLLTSPVTLANGSQLTVTYTVDLVFPA